MTGTERKRIWRRDHPEQRREAERVRAQARRNGYWGTPALGVTVRPCASGESYTRYELSARRFLQKMNWRRIGPGSMQMSREERQAAQHAYFVDRAGAVLGVEVDGTESFADLVAKAFSGSAR